MRFRARRSSGPEINLTSMIDVLFIVLMFLLLTTTFKDITFIRVTLPEAATSQRDVRQPPGRIQILVEQNGTVYLGGRPVSLGELRQMLDAVPDKEAADVALAADEALSHGRVVAVMDTVRRAGISRLTIQTIPGAPPAPGTP